MSFSPRHSISTTQAAERLGISREHVRRLILRGELHAEETVNGFMLKADEVEEYAFVRCILQDQRQFRAAINDLAATARHTSEAANIKSAIAQVRNQMKSHSAFDIAAAVAPQVKWIEEQVAAREQLAALMEPTMIVAERWRQMEKDSRRKAAAIRAREQASLGRAKGMQERFAADIDMVPAILQQEQSRVVRAIQERPAASPKPSQEGGRSPDVSRGFVVPEAREARLEQKVDALSRKVEQLTELIAERHTDTEPEMPTWQRWAGSDRPEDILAKLDAVREAATGGKQAGEDSTAVVREAREVRGEGV